MSRGKDTICSGVCDLRCFGDKTPLDEPLVLSSRVSRQNNAKPHRHYFDGCFASLANPADCDLLCESTANQTQICNISSLRAQFIARGNPFFRFCDS